MKDKACDNMKSAKETSTNAKDQSDCPCAVCGELFSQSRPGEQWIRCAAVSTGRMNCAQMAQMCLFARSVRMTI